MLWTSLTPVNFLGCKKEAKHKNNVYHNQDFISFENLSLSLTGISPLSSDEHGSCVKMWKDKYNHG